MELRIREIAERVGIANASQLRQATGLGVSTCYQLWDGTAKRLDIDTLNTLCNVLKASPALLFDYTPDVPIEQKPSRLGSASKKGKSK